MHEGFDGRDWTRANLLDGSVAIGRFEQDDLERFPAGFDNIVFVDSTPMIIGLIRSLLISGNRLEKYSIILLISAHTSIGYIGGHNRVNNKPVKDVEELVFIERLTARNLYHPEFVYTGEKLYSRSSGIQIDESRN